MINKNVIQDIIQAALYEAWRLGQVYWEQADNESYKRQKMATITLDKFKQLVEDTSERCSNLLGEEEEKPHEDGQYPNTEQIHWQGKTT